MKISRGIMPIGLVSSLCIVLALGIVLYEHHRRVAAPKLVYTSQGFGGYVLAPKPTPNKPADKKENAPSALYTAYNAGKFSDVARLAALELKQPVPTGSMKDREKKAEVRLVLAYADARQKNLVDARNQFALLEHEAAYLPDRGKETAPPNQPAPTIQAEAAYEHAVCTGALGDKKGAEAEYLSIMKRFPESPLVNTAAWRIMKLHGGNMPAADQAVWQQAKDIVRAEAEKQARSQAVCGPECLAELLRRQGKTASVESLAQEAGTSGDGTSMQGLAEAARRHGYSPQGLALSQKGLLAQRLPAIALMGIQHYVIVEKVMPAAVTVWDPDAHGVGHGARSTVPMSQWVNVWHGYVLALQAES